MGTERPAPPAERPAYVTDPIERQDPDALESIRDYVDELLAYHRAVEARDLQSGPLADEDEDLVDVEESEGGARRSNMREKDLVGYSSPRDVQG